MTFSEDLAVFMSDLGSDCRIGTSRFRGVLEEAFEEFDDVEGTAPRLHCVTADLPSGVADGTSITVGTRTFIVRSVQPDGTGVSVLLLEEPEG